MISIRETLVKGYPNEVAIVEERLRKRVATLVEDLKAQHGNDWLEAAVTKLFTELYEPEVIEQVFQETYNKK